MHCPLGPAAALNCKYHLSVGYVTGGAASPLEIRARVGVWVTGLGVADVGDRSPGQEGNGIGSGRGVGMEWEWEWEWEGSGGAGGDGMGMTRCQPSSRDVALQCATARCSAGHATAQVGGDTGRGTDEGARA